MFSQEISVAQRRSLSLDDINYDAVAAYKQQVADEGVAIQDVLFPEVVIDVRLRDMTDDQHPVIGDWYVDTELKEAQLTYRFSMRSTFDKEHWINEQRDSLRHVREAKGDQGDGAQLWQRVDFPIGEYRHMIYGGGQPSNECEAYLLRMLCVEILDALRNAERELTGGGDQRLLYRVLRQRSDTRYADLKEHLLDLEAAIRGNAALSSIKVDVATLLERVSLMTTGEDHSIDFHFSAPDATEMLKKIGMIYGANPITMARNGLGRNNLLYVALVLSQLAKATDLPSANEEFVCFRFVGIEEPEAHLHPHLQDHLANNIEEVRREYSDSLQLLLTSHSTHIAAKLRLENTAVLFRDDLTGSITAPSPHSASVRSGLQITPRYAASAACFLQAPYVPRRHEVQCFTLQAAMNLGRLWYRERNGVEAGGCWQYTMAGLRRALRPPTFRRPKRCWWS